MKLYPSKFLVVHPNPLDEYGGAEKVCHNVLKVLSEWSFDIELLTFNFDKTKYATIHGEIPKNVAISFLGPYPTVKSPFTIYKRNSIIQNALAKVTSRKYDVLFSTQSLTSYGELLGKAEKSVGYIHFPEIQFEYDHASFKRKLYLWKFKNEMNCTFKQFDLLLCNSNFTKEAIKTYLGSTAEVLYPSINLDALWCSKPLSQRKTRVVTVGRFIPSKQHDLMNKLAKTFPSVEFVSVGGLSKNQEEWFNSFSSHITSNYKLMPNLSNTELIRLLQSSRCYVHLMKNEHFGLSPVEALACGCVTIVHDSGGMCEFIPTGFRWQDFEDLKCTLEFALNISDTVWSEERDLLWKKISCLSFDAFKNKLMQLLYGVAKIF
jgi:glycosyltransferase involved in cell wall biosynthesis